MVAVKISRGAEALLAADRARKRRKTSQLQRELQFSGVVSDEELQRMYQECLHRLSNSSLDEMICSVCDCWHFRQRILRKQVVDDSVFIRAVKQRLRTPEGLHPELVKCYDVSETFPCLVGVLLSRKGIINNGASFELSVCKSCYQSLMKTKRRSPPKFAIANGLYIGWLPDKYADTTPTEHAMLGLAQPTKMLSIVRGGRHTTIRAHAYYFRAGPSTPASLLPREVVADGTIGVTMVGSMTSLQKATTYWRYAARVDRLEDGTKRTAVCSDNLKSRETSYCAL